MKNKYSNFGLSTLLDVVPDAIQLNTVRKAIELHKEALVSFVVPREHHSHHTQIIGSGFFQNSNDPTSAIIITAKHVLEDFERLGFGWITINTQMVPIKDIGTRVLDPTFDIAMWIIPSNYLLTFIPPRVASSPLLSKEILEKEFDPTCSFALFGYPGSKNQLLDMRQNGKRERSLFALALHGYAFDANTKELCFHYAGKGTPESWAKHITSPPKLAGMSGSPCVRFVISKETNQLAVVVAGVFARKSGSHEIRATALSGAWLNNTNSC